MILYAAKNDKDRAIAFLNKFELQTIFVRTHQKPKDLKNKGDRVCRFCGLKRPLVSFKKEAHIIPELLGNRNLISDFECDQCNEKFGLYENHLANFLGITRTINGIHAKTRVPKFKFAEDTFLIENNNFQTSNEGNIFIRRSAGLEEIFSINAGDGTFRIKCPVNSYVPLLVYKAFLKIALSCLPEDELKYYGQAITYLTSTTIDHRLTNANFIFLYSLTLGINFMEPMVMLMKKKNAGDELYTHWCILYFQNFICQFFIPLNGDDFWLYNRELKMDIPPPLSTDPVTATKIDELGSQLHHLDLSGTDLKKNESNFLNLYLGRDTLINMGVIDALTGHANISDHDLNKIIALKISRKPGL